MSRTTVLMVSSECYPYAKTGGLSEVIPALSKALTEIKDEEYQVSIVIPYYGEIKRFFPESRSFKKENYETSVVLDNKQYNATVFSTEISKKVKLYFIENNVLFNRDGLYGYDGGDFEDNTERFYFFSRIVFEMIKDGFLKPNIIHLHDWHTSLLPAMIKSSSMSNDEIKKVKTLLTIHNIGYQGIMNSKVGVWSDFNIDDFPEEIFGQLLGDNKKLNFLKTGIVFSDKINTVSPSYAKEIQTAEYGFGMERLLQQRANDLHGVLNGGDYDVWSPECDQFIPANFSVDDISGKEKCKRKLCDYFDFDFNPNVPTIAVIARLTYQKGLDLLRPVWEEFRDLDLNFVLLGDGDSDLETFFLSYAREYPKKFGVRVGFNEKLAHLIQAGSDMFLMPSRYEPCGLTQMYALKYGTVPIVRSTGGLADTVENYNETSKTGDGFVFDGLDPQVMLEEIKRALKIFADKSEWSKMMSRGMKKDFSYDQTSIAYSKIYKSVL
jgi:starch synthase